MPTPAEVLQDPNFQGLPMEERRKVLSQLDSNFGGLPATEQDKVLGGDGGDKIGIRASSAFETVKDKFRELVSNPIDALSNLHPGKTDVDSSVPYWLINGTASGEGLAATTAKNFLKGPSTKGAGILGRPAAIARNAKQAFNDAAESIGTRREAQQAAQRFDEMAASAPPKPKYSPLFKPAAVPKTGSGRPLTADEIAFQQTGTHPGIQPEPYTPPQPAPYVEPPPRPSKPKPAAVPMTKSGRPLTEDEIAFQNAPKESGPESYNYTPSEPVPPPLPPSKPDPLVTSAENYKSTGKLKSELLKFRQGSRDPVSAPGRSGGGKGKPGGSNPDTPPPEPKNLKEEVEQAISEPVKAPKAEAADTPAKAPETPEKPARVRATPDAQKRADEIAALNRHGFAVPLAQQTVDQGVTSKDLLALSEDAKKAYMAKIGMANRSEETWRNYVGHVQRIEKTRK